MSIGFGIAIASIWIVGYFIMKNFSYPGIIFIFLNLTTMITFVIFYASQRF